MKKFVLTLICAIISSFCFSQTNDDYSFINNDKDNESIVYSIDSSAYLYKKGSYMYLVTTFDIDKNSLESYTQTTGFANPGLLGLMSNTTKDVKFQINYKVYKDKKLWKDKKIYQVELNNGTKGLKFRCRGMYAPTANSHFNNHFDEPNLIIVMIIPQKDGTNKNLIFKGDKNNFM